MTPKLKTTEAWEQAELLMQPTLIRVIDNIRKELETSSWNGTYLEILEPIPGYQLCLTRQQESVNLDIWDLCFQVCFVTYNPQLEDSQEVEIDTTLIDDSGDVDWQQLETKTQFLIKQIFANLPNI